VYSQDVQKYTSIILGGGMVAGYAAKEAVEGDLKAGQLAIVSADEARAKEAHAITTGSAISDAMRTARAAHPCAAARSPKFAA